MKYTPQQTEAFFLARYEELGLSQTELGLKTGIQPADFSRYKTQKARPRVDQLDRLANALQVDMLTLLIGLGVLDPDGPSMPKVIQDGKNTRVVRKK